MAQRGYLKDCKRSQALHMHVFRAKVVGAFIGAKNCNRSFIIIAKEALSLLNQRQDAVATFQSSARLGTWSK